MYWSKSVSLSVKVGHKNIILNKAHQRNPIVAYSASSHVRRKHFWFEHDKGCWSNNIILSLQSTQYHCKFGENREKWRFKSKRAHISNIFRTVADTSKTMKQSEILMVFSPSSSMYILQHYYRKHKNKYIRVLWSSVIDLSSSSIHGTFMQFAPFDIKSRFFPAFYILCTMIRLFETLS